MGVADLEDARVRDRLADFIAAAAGSSIAELSAPEPLDGGALQENWALDAALRDGPMAGRHALVLRTDAASAIAESHGRAEEFALLTTAYQAGVTVPEPLWLCREPDVIGAPFFVMRRLAGTADGLEVVAAARRYDFGPALAARLGAELARIHAVTPASGALVAGLGFLGPPAEEGAAQTLLARLGRHLDRLPMAYPALAWAHRWLTRAAPAPVAPVLLHNDYRTGNYLVEGDTFSGVLDWEFAGWGDPLADIGWFCAKCWRFGACDRAAGGIADRESFYRAYEDHSGRVVVREDVRYWEVMAHLRWAITAILQGQRHLSGAEPSLELALTGRRPAELEFELLRLTGADMACAA